MLHCNTCKNDDPVTCAHMRYPAELNLGMGIAYERPEPCCCMCHDEYYEKMAEEDTAEEFSDDL